MRQAHQNRVPAPETVLEKDDVLALAGESEDALQKARVLIGESAAGRITKDRLNLDYFRLFVSKGAAIIPIPVLFNLFVGHFLLRLRFDDLLGANAGGVGGNPAILAFASKLVPTDRTDITYATTFPAATITKIILVQIMLAMMGKS